ncbi:MAG: hypothetical protein ACPGU1_08020 [Myxococcota bacterium]
MEGSDLDVGRRIAERYEVVRLLSDQVGQPRWLVRDRESGKRREMRPAPEGMRTQEQLDARALLGPYVIKVHGVEAIALDADAPERMTHVIIVDHHAHAITMATLAGTWKGVLLKVVAHVADGLSALHRVGRVAGVLTPTSVQVVSAAGGFVPVLDDLSGWSPSAEDFSGPWVTGDAAFAAPEVLTAGGAGSAAGDIFSFGVLTAQAWSGCMPFRDEGSGALFGRGPSVLARRPRELGPGSLELGRLTPALAEVIARCVSLEPSERPSAEALLEALEALQTAPATPASTPAAQAAVIEEQPPPEPARPAAPSAEFQMDLAAISRSVDEPAKAAPSFKAIAPPPATRDQSKRRLALRGLGWISGLLGFGLCAWLVFAGDTGTSATGAAVASQPSTPAKPTVNAAVPLPVADLDEGKVTASMAQVSPDVVEVADVNEPEPLSLAERSLHAALPALGCVGEATVYSMGPPLVIELPCHVRCLMTLNDEGVPERLVRCRGKDVAMTGEGTKLACIGGIAGSQVRCKASAVFLLGSEERRVSDTLTLRIGP